ncbi:spheroidene monooxygenase [Ruegeria sp. THAF33]|uniref:spheroidene monooxygenase n=1 Tax=Ruegeria sp. THAF33 TaxID=2587853 RepID=UPI00352A70AD
MFRFDGVFSRLGAFAMMGLARWPLSRLNGLEFWKLCGSGTGEGFTPRPNTAVWAVLCVWSDEKTAQSLLKSASPFRWYRNHACEHWTVFLRPISSRGAWSGQNPFHVDSPTPTGSLTAALTRATLKPKILMRFWRRVPDISQMIGANSDVLMKVGLGEVPFLHQITFSIWPDTGSMAAFARHPGPHSEAVKAVREGNWFREELYARFDVINEAGHWEGKHPVVLKEGQDNT